MALTMTRTRTQTALTRIAQAVADVHGELAFVEGLLADLAQLSQRGLQASVGGNAVGRAGELAAMRPDTRKLLKGLDPQAVRRGLEARRRELEARREALYVTLKQFDPGLEPSDIGETDVWLRGFGRGAAGRRRYLSDYACAL